MNTKFIKGITYAVVNWPKLFQSIFYRNLACDLGRHGTIVPLVVDAHGCVRGIQFSDGTIDVNAIIDASMAFCFAPIEPEACSAAMLIPKPNKPLSAAANDPLYDSTQPPECYPQLRAQYNPEWAVQLRMEHSMAA